MIGVRALLVLGILQSLGGQVLVNEKVRAWIGSSVVLNCNIKILEGVVTQVTWKRNEKGQNVDFLTYSGGKVQKLTKFAESRVEFLGNQPTEGSIMIRDVTLADESVYTCIFTTFPSGAYSNMSSLIVQAEPDIHVEPLPNPVVAKLPFQTVGTCVAGAAKPAANISWWTDVSYYATRYHYWLFVTVYFATNFDRYVRNSKRVDTMLVRKLLIIRVMTLPADLYIYEWGD
uniref:Ig-like domain-containing protein n=1 Tax=Pyxicephalus adspersus TaxID=30357 RepID=A0AAV3B8I0_PYXAD|nr:TPA: hypothetical protein GDO54_002112 [Pyxicephalus adspersus]